MFRIEKVNLFRIDKRLAKKSIRQNRPWYYPALGYPYELMIIRPHVINKFESIMMATEKYMERKIQRNDKCSLCRHRSLTYNCNCTFKYCTTARIGLIRNRWVFKRKNNLKDQPIPKPKTGKKSGKNLGDSKIRKTKGFGIKGRGICGERDLEEERLFDSSSDVDQGIRCVCGRPAHPLNPSPFICGHDGFELPPKDEAGNYILPEEVPPSEWQITREHKFPVGEILQVKFLTQEKTGYWWIRLSENAPLFEKLCNYFMEIREKLITRNPEINDLYVSQYKEKFYRVKIVGVNPVTVRCIDTGVKFYPETPICKQLCRTLALLPELALQVMVADESVVRGNSVNVQVVTINARGMYEIRVLDGIQNLPKERTYQSKFIRDMKGSRRHIYHYLGPRMCGLFQATYIDYKEMVGYFVPDEVEDATVSYRHVTSLLCMIGEQKEAEIGELVMAGTVEGEGHRGIVRSKIIGYGYEVVLIDRGYTAFSEEVFNVPKLTLNLVDLGVKIIIKSKDPQSFAICENSNYFFEIIKQLKDGRWLCGLKKNYEDEDYPATCIVQRVDESVHRVNYVPFESGCTVIISSLCNAGAETIVYVRRVDGNYAKKFNKIIEKVRALPITSDRKFYTEIEFGDIIGGVNKDGLQHRVRVIYREEDTISARFLDIGHELRLKVCESKPLPPPLVEEPALARRVPIVGSEVRLNEREYSFLQDLFDKKEELIMYYAGMDISDGVALLQKHGKTINVLDDPSMKQENYIDDFTQNFFQTVCYPVGIVQDFAIRSLNETEFTEKGIFWATNPNVRYGNASRLDSEKIAEHCQLDEEEYSPSAGELCFALFRGVWYRGFVKEVQGSDFEILLIDYGNTVTLKPKYIRKMEVGLFDVPPRAMKCVLEGYEKLDSTDRKLAYEYFKSKRECCINVAIITKVDEMGSDVYINELCTQFCQV